MFEDIIDSEVMSLVHDLGLVHIGTPEYREWLAILTMSHYTKYWFCERVHDLSKAKRLERERLNKELYLLNKPYSRYVHSSLDHQSQICWQDED